MRITLATDFGTVDGYAAAMKGVMAAISPAAIIDDAAHDIEPGDVRTAAWALAAYWRRYPPGTVHVVVVDPGVGSVRRALAADCDGRFLVGPDNGVFTRVLAEAETWRAVSIENRSLMGDVVSATFHGRDIFAPAAAHLARGVALAELGPPLTDPVRFAVPQPVITPTEVRGEVVHVDRFGNLITNVPAGHAPLGTGVRMQDSGMSVARTYAAVPEGALLALIGSHGMLEISVRDGSAAGRLNAGRGTTVVVQRTAPGS